MLIEIEENTVLYCWAKVIVVVVNYITYQRDTIEPYLNLSYLNKPDRCVTDVWQMCEGRVKWVCIAVVPGVLDDTAHRWE